MELTTRFGLRSQATRLSDRRPSLAVRTEWAWHPPRAAPIEGTPNYARRTNGYLRPVRHTSRSLLLATGFGVGLLPVHSPLLRESRLVSFPPLSDMLKFSGSSRPSRGRCIDNGFRNCSLSVFLFCSMVVVLLAAVVVVVVAEEQRQFSISSSSRRTGAERFTTNRKEAEEKEEEQK